MSSTRWTPLRSYPSTTSYTVESTSTTSSTSPTLQAPPPLDSNPASGINDGEGQSTREQSSSPATIGGIASCVLLAVLVLAIWYCTRQRERKAYPSQSKGSSMTSLSDMNTSSTSMALRKMKGYDQSGPCGPSLSDLDKKSPCRGDSLPVDNAPDRDHLERVIVHSSVNPTSISVESSHVNPTRVKVASHPEPALSSLPRPKIVSPRRSSQSENQCIPAHTLAHDTASPSPSRPPLLSSKSDDSVPTLRASRIPRYQGYLSNPPPTPPVLLSSELELDHDTAWMNTQLSRRATKLALLSSFPLPPPSAIQAMEQNNANARKISHMRGRSQSVGHPGYSLPLYPPMPPPPSGPAPNRPPSSIAILNPARTPLTVKVPRTPPNGRMKPSAQARGPTRAKEDSEVKKRTQRPFRSEPILVCRQLTQQSLEMVYTEGYVDDDSAPIECDYRENSRQRSQSVGARGTFPPEMELHSIIRDALVTSKRRTSTSSTSSSSSSTSTTIPEDWQRGLARPVLPQIQRIIKHGS